MADEKKTQEQTSSKAQDYNHAWRCCKFNKIAQNMLLFFSFAPFYRNRYFWFRCFHSVPNGTHVAVCAHSSALCKCVGFGSVTDKAKVRRWNNDSIYIFLRIRDTHIHKTIIYENMEWTISILSDNPLKRLPRISLLNYFSSILTFIVDLPTDFLVYSIVMFAVHDNSIVIVCTPYFFTPERVTYRMRACVHLFCQIWFVH